VRISQGKMLRSLRKLRFEVRQVRQPRYLRLRGSPEFPLPPPTHLIRVSLTLIYNADVSAC
jgi:hypothetical protein